MDSGHGSNRAVILTALPVEYAAVRTHLSDVREEVHPRGTVYELGALTLRNGHSWEIAVVEVGAGNANAAVQAERAIGHFSPAVAIFVGVAGGLKDVAIGDVVVATRIYGYESGKVVRDSQKHPSDEFLPRPDVGLTSFRMEQRARAEAHRSDWHRRTRDGSGSRVFLGPIAAGEKVIASRRSAIFAFLRATYGDALAVEMEGRGFVAATRSAIRRA
jgi:nucleoside phosphorylase